MRPFHILKRNYKAEQPTHLLFVDTESAIEHVTTRLQRHTLALGFALYVRRRRVHGVDTYTEEPCRFTTPAQFWDFAEAHAYAGTKLTIYAHNWNYDAGILQTATIPHDRGWTCTSYVNEKPPFILKLRRGRATISMIDTLNYFGSALAALGEQIGLSKGEMPAPDAPESEWWWYCERDCRIVSELVLTWLRFLRDHDLGNYQATLASQAFTAYRHRFMSSPIHIHDRARICEIEREGYHGGRVECFQLGTVERQLHYLDVNSLYPYVMREHPYPTRYVEARRAPPIDTLARWVESSCVVARVEVETSEPVFPSRHLGKLVFGVGRYWTTLNTPELVYALQRGLIRSTGHAVRYDRADLFRDWVDELYGLRLRYVAAGDRRYAMLCKYMLNSLYGKFGQSGSRWHPSDREIEGDHETILIREHPSEPVQRLRSRMGQVQEFRTEGESRDSFPAIAAHVTAHGRMYMWELMQRAGLEHVYYTDTDSLIVDDRGYRKLRGLVSSDELGALKVEGTATSSTFHGAKDYLFGDVEHIKGVRRNATRLSESRFDQDRFYSWDYLLSKGIDGAIYVSREIKELARNYDKGVRSASGRVTPLRIGAAR